LTRKIVSVEIDDKLSVVTLTAQASLLEAIRLRWRAGALARWRDILRAVAEKCQSGSELPGPP